MKNNKDLKLIFLTKTGEKYSGEIEYEFIFSKNYHEAIGEGWEEPCMGEVERPKKKYIDKIVRLWIHPDKLDLDVLTDEDEFRYLDGVFNVISLAWEYIPNYSELPALENIVTFHFGDSFEDIRKALFSKDILFEPEMV